MYPIYLPIAFSFFVFSKNEGRYSLVMPRTHILAPALSPCPPLLRAAMGSPSASATPGVSAGALSQTAESGENPIAKPPEPLRSVLEQATEKPCSEEIQKLHDWWNFNGVRLREHLNITPMALAQENSLATEDAEHARRTFQRDFERTLMAMDDDSLTLWKDGEYLLAVKRARVPLERNAALGPAGASRICLPSFQQVCALPAWGDLVRVVRAETKAFPRGPLSHHMTSNKDKCCGAPVYTLASLGIESVTRLPGTGGYTLEIAFPALFSRRDSEWFQGRWDGTIWSYASEAHASKKECVQESCLNIFCFLLAVAPQAVVLHSYGKNNAMDHWSQWKRSKASVDEIRRLGELCQTQGVDAGILDGRVRELQNRMETPSVSAGVSAQASGEVQMSPRSLRNWLVNELPERQWVKTTAPFLWPVFKTN